jgi:hypothetical protein
MWKHYSVFHSEETEDIAHGSAVGRVYRVQSALDEDEIGKILHPNFDENADTQQILWSRKVSSML